LLQNICFVSLTTEPMIPRPGYLVNTF